MKRAGVIAAIVVAFAVVVLFGLYVRGGGALPGAAAVGPLAPSGPAELVARTLRLAGIDRAAVGERDGVVVVRVVVPSVDSAADLDLTWRTATAAAAAAYPAADRYVVQLMTGGLRGPYPLLQASSDGPRAREAVKRDDRAALRAATVMELQSSAGAR